VVSFERVFNETIFQRVEGDDDSDAPGEEDPGEHCGQHGFNVLQFLVHSNSEGLKDASGSGASGVGAKWPGDFADAGHEICGGLYGFADSAAVGDVGSDSRCSGFFAPSAKDGFQLFCGGIQQESSSWAAFGGIETHIEHTTGIETETAFVIGKLIGREPEIKQNAVDCWDIEFLEHLRGGGVTGVHKLYTGVIESGFGVSEHEGIAVKTDQSPCGPELSENECAVPGRTYGAIHDSQLWPELQPLQDLPGHNGHVDG
jgi:hypothetical protein